MIVGIDLGTTNSLAAVWRDGEPKLVPNALGEFLTPSIVAVDDNGEILVGRPAAERLLTRSDLTVALFKRQMGTNKTFRLGSRDFRPEELSSLVLRSLKRDVEMWTGEAVEEVIISVPAYFNDSQRKATRIAGELVGLKVERLINEPTAAALAYGLSSAQPETQFLVFDLGGGTFDVTIVELFEGVIEVRATAGDNFLGGEDFVNTLIDRFLIWSAESGGPTRKQVEGDRRLYQLLRREAEQAKRQLTGSKQASMKLSWNDATLEFSITEDQAETWFEPLLNRIRQPVERALRDANIRPSQLSEILLVGGATRMPLVRQLVTRMFGRFPATRVNPDEAVALGVAVQGGLKARDSALKEIVLTDVCPYTLGVEICERIENGYQAGFFMPIIERNTVIPASRSRGICTIHDKQTKIDVRVFQGESRKVQDNIFLGSLHVAVSPKPKGEENVDIRFTYDLNGLLEVEATVLSTGLQKRIVIEENPGVLTPEEIARRVTDLAALKIHPFDQVENRTLIARAERMYEEFLGEIRELIGRNTQIFQNILQRQDPRAIEQARKDFAAFLDSFSQ
jgi:molecular chaperone HscC